MSRSSKILLALLVGATLVSFLGLAGLRWLSGVAQRQSEAQAAARSEREARDAAAKKAAEESRESAAAAFSPEKFAQSFKPIEQFIRAGDWDRAHKEASARLKELSPILGSSRGSHPEIVRVRDQLKAYEDKIASELARRAEKELAEKHKQEEERGREERRRLEASAIPAGRLYSEFDRNEVRANAEYKGQVVRVSGAIERIGTDILGTPYIALGTSSPIFSVQAMFTKADENLLADLSVGERVIVSCRCTGMLGNVLLDRCSILAR